MKIIFIIIIFYTVMCNFCFAGNFEIKGDEVYLDGKPFFINAIGYAPWRAGQWPGKDKVSYEIIEYDFKLIKEAGFNTVRTWEFLDEKELMLAEKYGLYVIQGIWIEPNHDYSDKLWQDMQIQKIQDIVRYTKKFTNVLFYLIMTEPTAKAIVYTGKEETEKFFKRIMQTVRELDNRPVSMDSWIPIGFLDHSMWDIATFNVFMFVPESINRVLGFEGYVRFIKKNYALNKPLFIGETGGFSVSKKREGLLCFGGNTEEEQSKGDIDSIKICVKAGAVGVATVSWVDTWHYPSEPRVHDDTPWEWDGILAIEDKDHPYGRPRKIFYDLKKFHESFLGLEHRQKQEKKQVSLIVNPAKNIFNFNEKILVNISLKYNNKPLLEKNIKYGFFTENGWQEYVGNAITNDKGQITVECPLVINEMTGYVLVFAALDDKNLVGSDLKFIKIKFEKNDEERFWVFKDKFYPGNHYAPSGWQGDYDGLTFSDDIIRDTNANNTCIKVTFTPQKEGCGWTGIFWQNPLYNWGEVFGGYNLRGKKELIFFARGEKGGEVISDFISGCIRSNKYQDSSISRIGPIVLTKEWKEYRIDLKGQDLSYISGGFGFLIPEKQNPNGCIFYIDDIYYR